MKSFVALAALPLATLWLWPSGGTAVAPNPPANASRATYVSAARAHYRNALEELRSRPVDHLRADERAARERALDALASYAERGTFGMHRSADRRLAPRFVDEAGRRCAVAELMHVSGRSDLVARIAATRNDTWVAGLEDDVEAAEWLRANGLTLDEAARIQLPGGSPPDWPPVFVPPDPSLRSGALPPGTMSPRDSTPRPTVPVARTGGPAGRGRQGATTGGRTVTGRQPATSSRAGGAPTRESWQEWWEYNKIEFLRPPRFRSVTGDGYPGQRLSVLRERATPLFRKALESPQMIVRAAGAVAFGRVAGERGSSELFPLLDDAHELVRASAMLGIGATANPEAAAVLLSIAENGSLPHEREKISVFARELALVSFGLARQNGLDGRLDALVPALLERAQDSDREKLSHATLVFHEVAQRFDSQFATRAVEANSLSTATRARAVENLGAAEDSDTLEVLADQVHSRRIELRQSAAMALAEHGNRLALPILRTAYEMEKEPTTRGFLLVAIGMRADDGAIEFLISELAQGPRTARPWCALALGYAARTTGADVAREAVREGFQREKNSQARGAYLLAMAIGEDGDALEQVIDGALEASSPWTRMYGLQALGMLGGPTARTALLEALESESIPLNRIVLAQALGMIADERDVDALTRVLLEQDDARLQGLVAIAFALHGSPETTERLLELLEDDGLGAGARAAALDALGMILSRHSGLALAEVGRRSNFNVFPLWVAGLLRFTL